MLFISRLHPTKANHCPSATPRNNTACAASPSLQRSHHPRHVHAKVEHTLRLDVALDTDDHDHDNTTNLASPPSPHLSSTMWNSYGSQGSLSPYTQPLDIPHSNSLSRPAAYEPNCAFPSWPQGNSLRPTYERATAYLSDDDLFPLDSEDDSRSVSSAGSFPAPPTEEELWEQQQQRAAAQRDALCFVRMEKDRRRQQAAMKAAAAAASYASSTSSRRSSSSSGSAKKSPSMKAAAMAPINEVAIE